MDLSLDLSPFLWFIFPIGTLLAACVLEAKLLISLARGSVPRLLTRFAVTHPITNLAFPAARWPFGFDTASIGRQLAFMGLPMSPEGFLRVKHLSLYLALLFGVSLFALVLGQDELAYVIERLLQGREVDLAMPSMEFTRGLLIATAGPAVLAGWFAPDFWLRQQSGRRRREILEQMPDFLELLAASMNAGAEYERALEIIARTMGGPLARELRLTIVERELAVPRSKYMQAFATRATMRADLAHLPSTTDNGRYGATRALVLDPETWIVDEFARTVDQATDLGTSLQVTLRDQAARMRQYRFAKAQELARASSVGVALPLGLMVLGMLGTILISLFYTGRQALTGFAGF